MSESKDLYRNRCNEMLYALLGSEPLIQKWWESPNKAFDMISPNEIWNNDSRYMEIYYYLMDHLQR